jgi:hypothetical protein
MIQRLYASPHQLQRQQIFPHAQRHIANADLFQWKIEMHLLDLFLIDLLHQPYAKLDHDKFDLHCNYDAHQQVK